LPKEDNPEVCRSFDLIYKGLEVSSGAQRIHVPSQLEAQLKKRGIPPSSLEFYIDAFRYGAPPHAGWSLGLERLTMKLLDLNNIREAMLFPRDRTRLVP
jgi:aspartyl-tRNA synthetase